MAIELYNNGSHRCIAFYDLVQGSGIQSNQFLIIDGGESALLEPGGYLTFTPLMRAMREWIDPQQLTYLIASHQDPDIIASLESWVSRTQARVVCSKLWSRFLPHLIPLYMGDKVSSRTIAIPDEGMDIPIGRSVLKCLPAHFLHSVGNFNFYDPVSKILFSGDIGASLTENRPDEPVQDFAEHIAHMEGFHRRYMANNRVCRMWANMVRTLDVEMIVPQHGSPFKGKATINKFLDWLSELQCGTDLFTQNNFRIN